MSTPEDTGVVRYTIKELFGSIDRKLDALDVKLDTKADHAALIDLTQRVAVLENDRTAGRATVRAVRLLAGAVFALFLALLPVAASYLN